MRNKFNSFAPVSNILLLSSPFIFLLIVYFNRGLNYEALIIYMCIALILFYVMFSRYGCKVFIVDNELTVIYLAPWRKKLIVNLSSFKYFTYGRSYYSFSLNHQQGFGTLFRICYDVLVLTNDDNKNQVGIKINTIMFGFKKMISFLKNQIGLTEINPNVSKEIIW